MKHFIISLFVLTIAVSCQNSQKNNTQEQFNSIEMHKPSSGSKQQMLYINDLNNTGIADIIISDNVTINFGDIHIYSKIGSSGKRKYISSDNVFIAKINLKEDAFKLKTESGNLLWKVKFKEGKIKISNNEEMINPYEIKKENNSYFKIKRNEETIGKAIFSNSAWKIEGNTPGYYISGNKTSSAGVISIEEIPFQYRLIIMSELVSQGK